MTQSRLISLWENIRLSRPKLITESDFIVGDTLRITLKAFLGELTPDDVEVQIYHGKIRYFDQLEGSRAETMWLQETIADGIYIYACTITCSRFRKVRISIVIHSKGDTKR